MSKQPRNKARQELKVRREMQRFLAEYKTLCEDYQMKVSSDCTEKPTVLAASGSCEYFTELEE